MTVLVVGGTEFVSVHLVRALRRDGHEVVVLNRGRRPERVPAGVRTIVCDRKDHARLRAVLAGERVDGLVDVTYAPTTAADVEALLEALDGRAGHVMLVSTGRVYDHGLPVPYGEDTPRTLYWGEYAKNKIEAEDVLQRRYRDGGVPVTIVRPTHVYGPLNTRNNETFFFDRLVRDRPVLLLDEPFGSLGPALRADMLDLLLGVQAERRMTVLFVTHQPEDAERVADDVAFLENGIVAAAGPSKFFFAEGGPEPFRRYLGTDFTKFARKQT